MIGIAVQNCHAKAIRLQQTADDVPEASEASEAGEDHRIIVALDLVVLARWFQFGKARLDDAVVEDQQQRRQSHAEGDGGTEWPGDVCFQKLLLTRHAE